MSNLIERTMRIDTDEPMGRHYIPVTLDWEIQTKGKGSSFRIAQRTEDGNRWLVGDSYLHKMLEQMARDINAESVAKDSRIAELEAAVKIQDELTDRQGIHISDLAHANAKMRKCLESIEAHHEKCLNLGYNLLDDRMQQYQTERRDFAREGLK